MKSRFRLSLGLSLVACVALLVGGISAAGASTDSKASASAKSAASKRGKRGKRGPRGKTGKTGPQGPAGPPGTPGAGGGGTGGGGGVQKIRFVANEGTALANAFVGQGFTIQATCVTATTATANARSTADNGVAASDSTGGGTTADENFDTNDNVDVVPATDNVGSFAYSGAGGNVASGVLLATGASGPQGDCVVAGTVQVAA